MVDTFKLIKNRQWNEVSSLLISSEGRKLTEQGNELGELPLHFAIWVRAPDYVVANFIKSHSKAVTMEDNDKWLPLHHAAFRDASPSVIELLIRAYPDALDKHNNNGDTPRHIMNNNLKSCVKSRELVAQPTQFWYNSSLESPASVKTEKFSNQTNNMGSGVYPSAAAMSVSFDNSNSSSYASLERRLEFLEVSFHKSLKELEKVNHFNEQLLQQNKNLETRIESFELSTIKNINELKNSVIFPSLEEIAHDKQELLRVMSEDKDSFKKSVNSLGTALVRLEDIVSRDVCTMRDETAVLRDSLDYHTHCFDQKLILTSKTIVDAFRSEMKSNLKPIRDNLFRMLCKMENSNYDSTAAGGDLRSVVTDRKSVV